METFQRGVGTDDAWNGADEGVHVDRQVPHATHNNRIIDDSDFTVGRVATSVTNRQGSQFSKLIDFGAERV